MANAEDYFNAMEGGCLEDIISHTSPRDACRLCLVSSFFGSAAQSDGVWRRFLPPDCFSILSRSVNPLPPFPSTKDLYFYLCHNPILIDQGRKSFSLDKESGKKCYMLSARELSIVWGDDPRYWRWIPLPDSRFEEVAELIVVCWFEIHGKIDLSMLSPSTVYAANLVFKSTEDAYGFSRQVGNAAVALPGEEKFTWTVVLDARRRRGENRRQRRNRNQNLGPHGGRFDDHNYPKERGDGWVETELGEFFYDGEQEGELEISISDLSGHWKSGLIIQGIEIRPKKV